MVVIVRAVVVELNNSVSQTMISPCFSKEGLLVSCQTGCVVSLTDRTAACGCWLHHMLPLILNNMQSVFRF